MLDTHNQSSRHNINNRQICELENMNTPHCNTEKNQTHMVLQGGFLNTSLDCTLLCLLEWIIESKMNDDTPVQ